MNVLRVPVRGMAAVLLGFSVFLSGCGTAASNEVKESLTSSVLSPFSNERSDDEEQGLSLEDELLGYTDTAEPAVSEPADIPQGITPEYTGKTPDFEKYGIPTVLAVNEDFVCPAIIETDMSQPSKGTLTVINYESKPVSDALLEFGTKNGCDFSGYEMKAVTTQIDFLEKDTGGKNVSISRSILDYYDYEAVDKGTWHKDHLDRDFLEYEVEYNGLKLPVYFWLHSGWTDYSTYYEYWEDAIFFVPAGYDGAVRGFVNPAREEKDIRKYHPESDVLLFRLT